MSAPPRPGPPDQRNDQLMQLYYELLTSDPGAADSVLKYIQSGWTTPVATAAQERVSQIVGRPVPTTGQPSVTPAPPPPQGPLGSTLPPANAGATATIGSTVFPQRQSPVPGNVGADQSLPDPFAAPPPIRPVSTPPGPAGSGSGGPLPAGPGPSLPVNDPQNPYNPGNTVAPPSTTLLAPVATTAPPATTPPGGAPVNPLDPNSAVGQGGYAAAMRGDKSALNAVLGKLLGGLGVDVTHPGWYTADIVDQVQPYLETFLRYYGLDNGAPAFDRAREAAGNFGNLIGGAGTFGKLQEYGRSLVPGINDFLSSGVDPSRQAGVVNDLAMLLGAGQNQIRQAATQQRLGASTLRSQMVGLDNPNQNYLDFLRQDAQANPQGGYGDLLRVLLGGR